MRTPSSSCVDMSKNNNNNNNNHILRNSNSHTSHFLECGPRDPLIVLRRHLIVSIKLKSPPKKKKLKRPFAVLLR
jgi:hypothetical protein